MGGAFLQPIGSKATLAASASRQAELKSRRFISSPLEPRWKIQRLLLAKLSRWHRIIPFAGK
jgi:hypothetical protein